MEILEYEHQRPPLGERLQIPSPGRERFATTVTAEHCPTLEPDERAEVRLDPAGVARVVDRIGDRHSQLLRRLRLAVPLEDPGLRLDDFRERPERDPVAVGKTAALAPRDQLRVCVDDPPELVHEPALAHSRDGDERDQLWDPLVPRAIERVAKNGELPLATYELGTRVVGDINAEAGARLLCLPDRNRIGLPLGVDRLDLAVVDRLPGRSIRRLVDEHAVDGSGGLQTSSSVDDIARRNGLTLLGSRSQPDERLSGRDPDPELDSFLSRVPADRKGGSHGTFGIILVRHRRSEQRHDRVADELLDRAAVALELGAQPFVVGPQDLLDVFRVELLRPRREADEVGEKDRDNLALSTRFGHALSLGRLEVRGEPGAARVAVHRGVLGA